MIAVYTPLPNACWQEGSQWPPWWCYPGGFIPHIQDGVTVRFLPCDQLTGTWPSTSEPLGHSVAYRSALANVWVYFCPMARNPLAREAVKHCVWTQLCSVLGVAENPLILLMRRSYMWIWPSSYPKVSPGEALGTERRLVTLFASQIFARSLKKRWPKHLSFFFFFENVSIKLKYATFCKTDSQSSVCLLTVFVITVVGRLYVLVFQSLLGHLPFCLLPSPAVWGCSPCFTLSTLAYEKVRERKLLPVEYKERWKNVWTIGEALIFPKGLDYIGASWPWESWGSHKHLDFCRWGKYGQEDEVCSCGGISCWSWTLRNSDVSVIIG